MVCGSGSLRDLPAVPPITHDGSKLWQTGAHNSKGRLDISPGNKARNVPREIRVAKVRMELDHEADNGDDADEAAEEEKRGDDELAARGLVQLPDAWQRQSEDYEVCGDVGDRVAEEEGGVVDAVAAGDGAVPPVGDGRAGEDGDEDHRCHPA